jgi:hypothetical protein
VAASQNRGPPATCTISKIAAKRVEIGEIQTADEREAVASFRELQGLMKRPFSAEFLRGDGHYRRTS